MLPDSDADLSPRRFRALLFLILVFALGLRIAWAFSQPVDAASIAQLPDQSEYLALAKSLLSGAGLHFFDARFGQTIYAYRMPGYPALMAACAANPLVIRLVQTVLDTSTIWAIALMAAMILPAGRQRWGGLVGAAIVAVNPFLIYFSGLLLSETLFTAMLAWGMALLLAGEAGGRFQSEPADWSGVETEGWQRQGLGTLCWLFGGLLIAGSTLVRPSAAPLAIILGVIAAFVFRSKRKRDAAHHPRRRLPVAPTMALLTLAMLAPWAYRNSEPQVLGEWVWMTTNGGVTAFDGFNPDATGGSDQSMLAAMPQLKSMSEVARSQYLSDSAELYVREDPWRALHLSVAKAARTWSPMPLSAEYSSWKHRLVGLAYSIPLDLLALIGLFRGAFRRSAKAYLLAPIIYFTLVHMATVGSLRYRVPIEPLLAIFAAAALLLIRRTPKTVADQIGIVEP